MASLHREFSVDAPAEKVWDAVRDFGAVHTRLARGFVTMATMDGDARLVTFSNGTSARELLVDCDDARKRLVYAVISERIQHYSASVQIFGDGDGSRFVWIVDVLPNDVAPYISAQMDAAAIAMKNSLEN